MQDKYADLRSNQKADWWRAAIERLEAEANKETAIAVMRDCGRRCCSTGNRKTAKRLRSESRSMEEFLEKSSNYGVKPGEIEYFFKDEQTIIGRFHRCFCGQVKQTETPFKDTTYCNCSAEFHRQYFKAALQVPVQVEVVQSIIAGDGYCEFKVYLGDEENPFQKEGIQSRHKNKGEK